MSENVLFVFANVVALTIFVSVMVLTGVWLKQSRFIPTIKADPPGYWRRVVRYAWLALAISLVSLVIVMMVVFSQ